MNLLYLYPYKIFLFLCFLFSNRFVEDVTSISDSCFILYLLLTHSLHSLHFHLTKFRWNPNLQLIKKNVCLTWVYFELLMSSSLRQGSVKLSCLLLLAPWHQVNHIFLTPDTGQNELKWEWAEHVSTLCSMDAFLELVEIRWVKQ